MSKEYMGKKVLLLDGYGRQIPSLMQQLHRLGCVITVLCDSKLNVGYTSRYPHKKLVVRGIREDYDIYKAAVEKELSNEQYDILFPVLEKATEISLSDELREKYPKLEPLYWWS